MKVGPHAGANNTHKDSPKRRRAASPDYFFGEREARASALRALQPANQNFSMMMAKLLVNILMAMAKRMTLKNFFIM